MPLIQSIYSFITSAIIVMCAAGIFLIILRAIFNYTDANPFTWSARTVRRVTDPIIMPVRRMLLGFGIDPRAAPFVTIILLVLVAFFINQVTGSILNTFAG